MLASVLEMKCKGSVN